MKRFSSKAAVAAILISLSWVSCTNTARIDGRIEGAQESRIVIKQQNVNRYDVLDTLKTDADGNFSCKVPVAKGDPEFFYIYRGDVKLASLLLERGDKVVVNADTTGNFSVQGSEESVRLQDVNNRYKAFTEKIDSLAAVLGKVKSGSQEELSIKKEVGSVYTRYYRDCVRYVMQHSHSLTVVPIFFQTVGGNFYVFSQDTDAIILNNICDSIQSVYPDSRYLKSLREEAKTLTSQLELRMRLKDAESVGFLDIELPDVNGKKIKLSDIDSKVILLHFWTASDADQKMFNLDVLKGIYRDYHDKGLEIYQVALDVDKPFWARTVSAQGLEWINVCDGFGMNSPSAAYYNVAKLPLSFLIVDGQLSDVKVTDEASLRKVLDRNLK